MDTADSISILVIDDDPLILRLIGHYLRREGYSIRMVTRAREGLDQIAIQSPDLIILDVGLPDEDGFTFTRNLRAHSNIPIIMLTGKTDTVYKVVGLELGADDYITKPFEKLELLARIRSLLRRSQASSPPSVEKARSFRFAGWRLDLIGHELFSPAGERVHLTSHEFRLLTVFARNPNHILSRDALMDQIAGRDWTPLDRGIDVLIAKLRKKIEADPARPALIKSIRGEGYKFAVLVEIN
jgi:two-component system, OmpR family, response regulator